MFAFFFNRFGQSGFSRNTFWMAHCFHCLQTPDLWPLSCLFVSAEASCRWGADAATGPRRQPDSHDAGHHGPELVLLQRQTDDGEGPGPSRALNTLDYSDRGDNGWANEKWRRWRRSRDAAVSSRIALFSLHSHNHTQTLNFWDPSLHHAQRLQGCC